MRVNSTKKLLEAFKIKPRRSYVHQVKWKIIEEKTDSMVFQEERDDAQVVITIPKTLVEYLQAL